MNRRFRILGALLALSALSASYAEGVWASSTCAAMGPMDMEGMGSMAMDEADPPVMRGHAMGSMAGPDSTQPDKRSDTAPVDPSSGPAPDCPLLAVAGGCTAVSFPAAEPTVGFASPVPAAPTAALSVSPELLLATSLLRPPKA